MLQPPTLSRAGSIGQALLGSPSRRLFATRDLAEARAMVSRVMKPHELKTLGAASRLDARMHHASLGEVSLSRLAHGAAVQIEPGRLDDFFLVMMPLAGGAELRLDDAHEQAGPGRAAVVSPTQALRMRWSADCDQLMVRIARPWLERLLAAQRGRPLTRPLAFAPVFEASASPAWQCALRLLVDCAESGLTPAEQPLLLAQVQQLVATTLLAEQPHNHRHDDSPRATPLLPRHVRRAQAWLREHAHEPVTAAQLAEVAGCSLRALYAGFQQFCGCSPMQMLRQLRLDQARSDLMAAGPGASVSGVALRWGFAHLGRFSAEYKARFGESPSQTLRQG